MKRFIKILSIFLLTGIVMSSCEESDDKTFEQKAVQFATDEITANVLKLPVQNDTASITVELTSAPLDKDVTIYFKPHVDDEVTALEGEHYEVLNNSVTIPAGEVKATVDYAEVIHEHFMVEEEVLAKVKFDKEKSDLPPLNRQKSHVLNLNMKKRNVCPFEATDIAGTYDVTEVGNSGEYPNTIEIYYPTPPSEQEDPQVLTFKIGGLWYSAPNVIWNESIVDSSHVEAVFDITSIAENTISISQQYLETSTDGSTEYDYDIYTDDDLDYFSELSHYDGCNKIIKIYYVIDSGGPLDIVQTYINVEEKTAKVKSHTLPLDLRKEVEGEMKQRPE